MWETLVWYGSHGEFEWKPKRKRSQQWADLSAHQVKHERLSRTWVELYISRPIMGATLGFSLCLAVWRSTLACVICAALRDLDHTRASESNDCRCWPFKWTNFSFCTFELVISTKLAQLSAVARARRDLYYALFMNHTTGEVAKRSQPVCIRIKVDVAEQVSIDCL